MSNQTTDGAAAFRVLTGSTIDGTVTISQRNLRAMAGLTLDELHAAEHDLQAQGIIHRTPRQRARKPLAYRLTQMGRELLAGMPPVRDNGVPEVFAAYEYADAGRLWGKSPRGVPMEAREVMGLAPDALPKSTHQWVLQLAALPVPIVTVARRADNNERVHVFPDLEADDRREIAEDIDGQQDRVANARARAA